MFSNKEEEIQMLTTLPPKLQSSQVGPKLDMEEELLWCHHQMEACLAMACLL